MFWNIFSAISTAAMVLIILGTAIFSVYQLRESNKSRKVAAFISVRQCLQDDKIRTARKNLMGILANKNFDIWTEEETEEAERVCESYDFVGVMVAKKLIEKDFIINEWRDSIIKCWKSAKPMVDEYRQTRGWDYWDDFETLYEMAKKSRREFLKTLSHNQTR